MKRLVSLLLVLVGASGCSAMTLTSKYQAIGQYGVGRPAAPTTPANQVEVFVQSAPPGFSLEKNELTVLDGYDHRVLGIVEVVRKGGFCDLADVAMKDVIALLQSETAARGGNAVIYAESKLSELSSTDERCSPKSLGPNNHFGVGWAVIRGVGPAPGTTPPKKADAPATPQEPSTTPNKDAASGT